MKICPSCRSCLADRHRICPHDGAPLEQALKGSRLLGGRYRLIRLVGRGGMGAVYLARHEGLQQLVAVKVLHPELLAETGLASRFEREARILARLRHPNIVGVTDYGLEIERDISFLVMELLTGTTLQQWLESRGAMPIAEALPVFRQVGEALDHAHHLGILHRDLKPGNVMLTTAAKTEAKVLDFGLAVFLEDMDATQSWGVGEAPSRGAGMGAVRERPATSFTIGDGGTPAFMAPEIVSGGRASPASDTYAFGVLAYATLVGRLPFEGSAEEQLAAHVNATVPPPSSVGPGLDPCLDAPILAALAKDPRRRPASARELVAKLGEAASRARRRQLRRQELPRSLKIAHAIGLVAAILCGVLSQPLQPMDGRWVDSLVYLTPPRPPTCPLLLVLIDEATLASDPRSLAARQDEISATVARLLSLRPAGVAVDLLLPEAWSHSSAFNDLIVRHRSDLLLASYSPPDGGPVLGTGVMNTLTAAALSPSELRALYGFVNLDEEPDGTLRWYRTGYLDVEGQFRPSFATRMAELMLEDRPDREPEHASRAPEVFRIDFSIDWRRFDTISWNDMESAMAVSPERFRDRLVLIGAVYAGASDGSFRVPRPRALPDRVTGPIVHAMAAQTILDGFPVRAAHRGWTLLGTWLLMTIGLWPLVWRRNRGVAAAAGTAAVMGWLVMSQVLFLTTRKVLPLTAYLVSVAFGLALAVASRRWVPPVPASESEVSS